MVRFIRATEAKEEEPSKKKQRIRAQMRPGEPDLANRRSLQIPPGTPQQATRSTRKSDQTSVVWKTESPVAFTGRVLLSQSVDERRAHRPETQSMSISFAALLFR